MQFLLSIARDLVVFYSKHAKRKRAARLKGFLYKVCSTFGGTEKYIVLAIPTDIPKIRPPFQQHANVALVIQGPLVLGEDFTIKMVKSYQILFPGSPIVVSTWVGSDVATVELLRGIGVHVLENELPKIGGKANINFQLVSTLSGIKYAKEIGAEFVIKTRADTRLYSPNIAGYLLGLWETYRSSVDGLDGRIIALDYATRLYVPMHLSDIFMFGHVNDMVAYWSASLRQDANSSRGGYQNLEELKSSWLPEVYLCSTFLKSVGIANDLENTTLEQWWSLLSENFIIVDRASIGFYWPKYNMSNENAMEDEFDAKPMAVCSHRDWVCLYQGESRVGFYDDSKDIPLKKAMEFS